MNFQKPTEPVLKDTPTSHQNANFQKFTAKLLTTYILEIAI